MKQILALFLILFSTIVAFAAGGDETAPMMEKEFAFKDFTHKNLRGGSYVNLRNFASSKKLVMVVYFAEWCPNWRREAPVVQRLYEKYKDKGFDVIAVSEYASVEKTRENIENGKFTFTVVTDSEKLEDREKTEHYEMRVAAGDTRRWGSPWNVFLDTARIEKKGDTLTKKTHVVNGEIIETEVETFIRQKLGLTTETKTASDLKTSRN